MPLRQAVHVVVVAQRELLDDRADDPRREHLPQEEVPDEFHVGKQAVLGLLAAPLQLLGIILLDFLARGLQCGRQRLEFLLAHVEEQGLEGLRLAPVGGRKLGEGRLDPKDQVGVGRAVVGLGQGLAEDDGDELLELLPAPNLNLCNLGSNCVDALRANLIQEALDRTPQLIDVGLASRDHTVCLGRRRQSHSGGGHCLLAANRYHCWCRG
mmetsp:Transcript_45241/g.131036  ORF Transcript_45241/g.131036 Transcript_45241/m.131036 type:complete len:211 (+) Transcript_45241:476-1108(+)